MKHFDVNITSDSGDEYTAHFFGLVPVPGTTDFTTDTSVTLATVELGDIDPIAAGVWGAEYEDIWTSTDDLNPALAEALADTIERLRA